MLLAIFARLFIRRTDMHGKLCEKVSEVAAMLKAIHAQEDRAAAEAKARDVVVKLRGEAAQGGRDPELLCPSRAALGPV
jgi:hypothetical protein